MEYSPIPTPHSYFFSCVLYEARGLTEVRQILANYLVQPLHLASPHHRIIASGVIWTHYHPAEFRIIIA